MNTLIFFLGFEYHNFVLRQITSSKDDVGYILFHQLILFGLSYFLCLPIFYLLFYLEIISIQFIYFFYLLIVAEHICTEIFRILVSLLKSNLANLLFLVRNGIAGIIIIIILWFYESTRSIYFMLLCNLFFSYIILIISLTLFRKFRIFHYRFDYQYFITGIKTAAKFFISGGCLILITIIDIYIYKYKYGAGDIGIMTFFRALSSMPSMFIYASVISILLPKYLKANSEKNILLEKKIYNKISKYSLLLIILSCITLYFLIYPVLVMMNKDILINNYIVFIYYLCATFIYTIGSLIQIQLFSQKKDKLIAFCAVLALLFNIIANLILIEQYLLVGNGIATVLTQLIWLLSMFISLNYLGKNRIIEVVKHQP